MRTKQRMAGDRVKQINAVHDQTRKSGTPQQKQKDLNQTNQTTVSTGQQSVAQVQAELQDKARQRKQNQPTVSATPDNQSQPETPPITIGTVPGLK